MKPCGCIPCSECEGSGTVWISFSGEYLGNNKCDDLDDLETCPACEGTGLSQICDSCREQYFEED